MSRVISLIYILIFLSSTYASSEAIEGNWRCGTPALSEEVPVFVKGSEKPFLRPSEIEIGDAKGFWAYDFSSGEYYQITATARSIGDNHYIFVEDEAWEGNVNQRIVEELAKAFEDSTPAGPDKGIYQIEREAFGKPPDVDDDPKIYILIMDIKDNYSGSGDTFYGGYFNSYNQYPKSRLSSEVKTNYSEIIYIDSNPLMDKSRYNNFSNMMAKVKAVLAHELQHLIHFRGNPQASKWINEGCSGYAEFITGYYSSKEKLGKHYLSNPNNGLTQWKEDQADYEKTFMFILYLAEHYGEDVIRELVSGPSNGTQRVFDALEAAGYQEVKFKDVFSNWIVANYLDIEGIYGYDFFELAEAKTSRPEFLPSQGDSSVQRWGVNYLEFIPKGKLRVNLNPSSSLSDLIIQRIEKKSESVQVDTSNTGDFIVSDLDTLTLAISASRISSGQDRAKYTYKVTKLTGVELAEASGNSPEEYRLCQNFPNPFNTQTLIRFSIPQTEQKVLLEVYNSAGQRIKILAEGEFKGGQHVLKWDGKDDFGNEVASGLYIYKLKTNGFYKCRKMLLLK